MAKQYIVKTVSGSLYEVQHHLINKWILIKDKEEWIITSIEDSNQRHRLTRFGIGDFYNRVILFSKGNKVGHTSKVAEIYQRIK